MYNYALNASNLLNLGDRGGDSINLACCKMTHFQIWFGKR